MSGSNLSFLRLKNSKTNECLSLCPDLGGTVTSLTLGKNNYQIMANDSKKELLNNPLFRGRILFPFNDRIPMGKYSFQDNNYQLQINCFDDQSAIHGFLYKRKMDIIEEKDLECILYWRTGTNKFKGYPFDMSLQVKIKLYEGGVNLSFTVKNEGDIPAPYALGWHSYFKADNNSTLKGNYPGYFETDKNFLPIGDIISTSGSKFDFSKEETFFNKNLDHTFIVPAEGTTILKNSNYSVIIKQKNFAYTQLFIPPDRKSIAIEPISSKPNSFNSNDVLILMPGKKYCASIELKLL